MILTKIYDLDKIKETLRELLLAVQLTGLTLPPRSDRPIWSYKFFGTRGGAFIMPNSDLVIRFPVGSLIKRVSFKGQGSKILEKGLNLALLFFSIRYSLFYIFELFLI
jgi:hypothetical protein